jgi:hypothetical protein
VRDTHWTALIRLASLSCFSSSNTMVAPSRNSSDAAAGDGEPPPSPPAAVGVRGVTGLFTGVLFQAGFGVEDARAFCHFLLAVLGVGEGEGEAAVGWVDFPLLLLVYEEDVESAPDAFPLDAAAGDAAGVE